MSLRRNGSGAVLVLRNEPNQFPVNVTDQIERTRSDKSAMITMSKPACRDNLILPTHDAEALILVLRRHALNS
jgi:hypothetical protein